MSSSTLGFTRSEIISKVLDTLGRTTDNTLNVRLQTDINLAQLAFWKLFDWKWGQVNFNTDGVPFITIQDEINLYTLETAALGMEMRATDIDKIYIALSAKYSKPLIKLTTREFRQMDSSATLTGIPEFWAIAGKNRIEIFPYPSVALGTPSDFIGQVLGIDGKRMPTFMSSDSDYPDIPIEYQETFIQYLLVRALNRERDPRSDGELVVFKDMLRADKNCDLREVESNLRMKWAEEELGPQGSNNLEWMMWNNE